MSKAYIVFESWNVCDDDSPIAVFLDEEKCDEFIKERNKDWEEDNRRLERCKKCRDCDDYDMAKDDVFLFKDTCEMANIGIDRHGMYCENETLSYYNRSSNYYSKYEVKLMD